WPSRSCPSRLALRLISGLVVRPSSRAFVSWSRKSGTPCSITAPVSGVNNLEAALARQRSMISLRLAVMNWWSTGDTSVDAYARAWSWAALFQKGQASHALRPGPGDREEKVALFERFDVMRHSVIEREKTTGAEAERPSRGSHVEVARKHVDRDPALGLVLGHSRPRL